MPFVNQNAHEMTRKMSLHSQIIGSLWLQRMNHENDVEIINYNFGTSPDLTISFDVLQTTPGLLGAVLISAGGHQLGRTGEVVFLYPVLLMCEELILLARSSAGKEQQLSSTEFFDGFTVWVKRAEDQLGLRWIGPDTKEVQTTVSFERAAKAVAEFRKLVDLAR